MRGQQQDAEPGHPAPQRDAERDAVAVGQVDVEDHAVDQARAQHARRLGDRADRGDDLQAGRAGEGVLEHRAEQRLVLDDGDAERGRWWDALIGASIVCGRVRRAVTRRGRTQSIDHAIAGREGARMTTTSTDSAAAVADASRGPPPGPHHAAARHRRSSRSATASAPPCSRPTSTPTYVPAWESVPLWRRLGGERGRRSSCSSAVLAAHPGAPRDPPCGGWRPRSLAALGRGGGRRGSSRRCCSGCYDDAGRPGARRRGAQRLPPRRDLGR